MLSRKQLREIARDRLRDAQTLFDAGRYDGAVYMCGYVVEIALKARIVKTLKWQGFPETKGDFSGLQSFKTHSLEMLRRLSGVDALIASKYLAEWSMVKAWDPEARYKRVGSATVAAASSMIQASKRLLRAL